MESYQMNGLTLEEASLRKQALSGLSHLICQSRWTHKSSLYQAPKSHPMNAPPALPRFIHAKPGSGGWSTKILVQRGLKNPWSLVSLNLSLDKQFPKKERVLISKMDCDPMAQKHSGTVSCLSPSHECVILTNSKPWFDILRRNQIGSFFERSVGSPLNFPLSHPSSSPTNFAVASSSLIVIVYQYVHCSWFLML